MRSWNVCPTSISGHSHCRRCWWETPSPVPFPRHRCSSKRLLHGRRGHSVTAHHGLLPSPTGANTVMTRRVVWPAADQHRERPRLDRPSYHSGVASDGTAIDGRSSVQSDIKYTVHWVTEIRQRRFILLIGWRVRLYSNVG